MHQCYVPLVLCLQFTVIMFSIVHKDTVPSQSMDTKCVPTRYRYRLKCLPCAIGYKDCIYIYIYRRTNHLCTFLCDRAEECGMDPKFLMLHKNQTNTN